MYLLQLLHQLGQRIAVIGLQHAIGGMQLLHVRVVRVNVFGERVLAGILSVCQMALLVLQATLQIGESTTESTLRMRNINCFSDSACVCGNCLATWHLIMPHTHSGTLTFDSFSSVFAIIVSKDSLCVNILRL